jgi:adenosylcobinamide kinase/adenosylcobinamide-phosphate guanylyltransferase
MIVLVIGGTRSGKSEVAEQVATRLGGTVTYVATARVDDDHDLASRVARHRARRPAAWDTVEAPADLVQTLRDAHGTVLVDSIGTWVAATSDFAVDHTALCAALEARDGDTVVVTEEVGMSVHPTTT